MQCWRAVLLVRIGGVDAAGARAWLVTRWSEPYGWRPTIVHVSVVPLPVPKVCSRVAPQHESSGRSACQALACGGELGADGRGCSSCDGGVRCPGPGRVLEEPLTLPSWLKGRVC